MGRVGEALRLKRASMETPRHLDISEEFSLSFSLWTKDSPWFNLWFPWRLKVRALLVLDLCIRPLLIVKGG